MAMIPTMMASTPSRINEVDDDLRTDVVRGVDVDVDMTGVPFVRLGVPFVSPGCVAAASGPRVRDCRGRDCCLPVFPGWPRRGRGRRHQPVSPVTAHGIVCNCGCHGRSRCDMPTVRCPL